MALGLKEALVAARSRRTLCLRWELVDEGADTSGNVVADNAHDVEGLAGGVIDFPVPLRQSGNPLLPL
jgi:hypothetical protein